MWGYWKDIKSDYESKLTDPWDWVTHFENAIARYAGAKHGIACDSNTNAIRLLIHYFKDVITGGGVGREFQKDTIAAQKKSIRKKPSYEKIKVPEGGKIKTGKKTERAYWDFL